MREAVETLLLLLGPFCPHIAEELWSVLGHAESLFRRPWPRADSGALIREEITVVVQVDGKVRSRLTVETGARAEHVTALALADDRVRPWLASRQVARALMLAAPRHKRAVTTTSGSAGRHQWIQPEDLTAGMFECAPVMVCGNRSAR